jgi:hypothetical protein
LLIFETDEKEKLFTQLNSGKYLSIVLGLEGLARSAGLGKTIKSIYEKVNCNLTIVPIAHVVRTEFKLLIPLEYKNLENLYMILRFQAYISFNCTRLTIVLRNDEDISQEELVEKGKVVTEIFPNENNEIVAHNSTNCNGYLIKNIGEKNFDYCIVFKGDFFGEYIFNALNNRTQGYVYSMKVVRSIPKDSDIETLKSGKQWTKH